MGRRIDRDRKLKLTNGNRFLSPGAKSQGLHQVSFTFKKQDSGQEEAFNDALQLFLRELVRQERNQKGGL
jgi:hypothetical protein